MATQGRHRSDLAGLCHEYLNNLCAALQETRITWMGACVPTPGMLIWTIVWKKGECFSILTETHACNPSCLVTTFDSFLNPSPPPASISLCAESQLLIRKLQNDITSSILPVPFCNSSHHIQKNLANPSQLSTCPNDFVLISFVPIFNPCHMSSHLCVLLSFLSQHKHALSSYISEFLRCSGPQFECVGWKGETYSPWPSSSVQSPSQLSNCTMWTSSHFSFLTNPV